MTKRFLLVFILTLGISTTWGQVFKKLQLDHAAVYVTNLQQSTKFYMGILGLDSIPEPFRDGRHLWLNLGSGISMHIIQGAPTSKEYFQNDHICLRTDDVIAFTKLLEISKITWYDVKGVPNKITTRPDGISQVWVKDPDGYWIEVNNANR